MSHIAEIQLKVKDLGCLERAVKKCGGELVRNVKQFTMYAGRKVGCAHVIRFPGLSYEVGVVQEASGDFGLQADFWSSGGLTKAIGQDGNRLKQWYGVELARKHYGEEGYLLQVDEKANGEIIVTCSK